MQEAVRQSYRHIQFGRDARVPTELVGENGFLFYREDVQFQWDQGPLSRRQAARIATACDVRKDSFREGAIEACFRFLFAQPVPKSESP